MNGFENAVKDKLREHGWSFARSAKGSHEYWTKSNHKPITVPHNCKSRFTANQIIKEARINYKF